MINLWKYKENIEPAFLYFKTATYFTENYNNP